MVLNIAQTYPQISLRHLVRYVHRRPGLCLPHMDEAAFGRIHAPAGIVNIIPGQMPHLLPGLSPVGAHCEHHRHLAAADPGLFQPFEHMGKNLPGRHGARNVAGDNDHILFPGCQYFKPLCAQGRIQGLFNDIRLRAAFLLFMGDQDMGNGIPGYVHLFRTFSVAKFYLLHCPVPQFIHIIYFYHTRFLRIQGIPSPGYPLAVSQHKGSRSLLLV